VINLLGFHGCRSDLMKRVRIAGWPAENVLLMSERGTEFPLQQTVQGT
jgi:hypothetical protein